MSGKVAYQAIYDFDRLERAARRLQMGETEETEIALFNLHNHLVWHSYEPGKDPAADAIFSSVLAEILEDYDLDVSAFPIEFREMASEVVERRQER